MTPEKDRRDFLKTTATFGAALTVAGGNVISAKAETSSLAHPVAKPIEIVRVGFVGIGVKGSAHLANLMRMPNVEIVAVCDVVEEQCLEAQRQAARLGLKKPTAYFRDDRDYERMCETENLDLVYTATPWRWHTSVCVSAMKNGSHSATEIPAAVTLEECWELVEISEKYGKYCVMMENANYQRNDMAIFNMVRKGLFGDVVHGEAGYMHDTRYLKVTDYGDGLWLGDHHAERNGNLYPCHGLGPLAWYMDLNHGDRMEYMVSMSSNAVGMDLYASEHLPAEHPKRKRKYINGDVNTCLIRTAKGRSIILKHDTDLPRPYSRDNIVQGTRGMVRGYPDVRVCLEKNVNVDHRHTFETGNQYINQYEHPLWDGRMDRMKELAKSKKPYGQIGKNAVWNYSPAKEIKNGDYFEDSRLIEALQNGVAPDYDVYDAASWSSVAPLSENSVANRSQAIDFPDFTKGKWKTNLPVVIKGV